MPAGYIAQVTGTAPNFAVAQFMQGTVADAPLGQSGWVPVNIAYPTLDNVTQIMTSPTWTVAADGSGVNLTFNVENLPQPWAQMGLINFATQQSQALAYGGITLPNGVQLATADDKIGALYDIIVGLQNGWLTSPFELQTASGAFVSLAFSDLEAAAQAVGQFRQQNYVKRQACIASIQAGTITSSADVLKNI
jgi:hypothetical protein